MGEGERQRVDALYRDVLFAHCTEIPILGIPTRFEANDARLLEEVERMFGAWRTLSVLPEQFADRKVRVLLVLQADDPADVGHPVVRYRLPDPHRFLLATPGSMGVSDLETGEGILYTTPSLVESGPHFRYAVLSALTLSMVAAHDRRAIHAAAIAGERGALLLHGPSGVGKSTLALAAAKMGLRVLAEDVVYAQLDPVFRLWGTPGPFHVPEDTLALFDDVGSRTGVVRASGKPKLAVTVESESPNVDVHMRTVAGICFVQASEGPPKVLAADPDQVLRAVAWPDEAGFDLYRGEMEDVVRHLLKGGAWVLHRGSNPHGAAAAIAELLEQVERNG